MTVKEYMISWLTERGLFPQHAEAVFEIAKNNKEVTDIEWNDDISGYPQQLLAVLLLRLESAAIEWMDANMPNHFARPLFTRDSSGKTLV